MPYVEISCFSGRTDEQKTLCAQKIAEVIADTFGCKYQVSLLQLKMFRKINGKKRYGMLILHPTNHTCIKKPAIHVNKFNL
ncbi:MAG: tautomerase family protein [bacterium]|nr:tautomerase family protein [bacterium]